MKIMKVSLSEAVVLKTQIAKSCIDLGRKFTKNSSKLNWKKLEDAEDDLLTVTTFLQEINAKNNNNCRIKEIELLKRKIGLLKIVLGNKKHKILDRIRSIFFQLELKRLTKRYDVLTKEREEANKIEVQLKIKGSYFISQYEPQIKAP